MLHVDIFSRQHDSDVSELDKTDLVLVLNLKVYKVCQVNFS